MIINLFFFFILSVSEKNSLQLTLIWDQFANVAMTGQIGKGCDSVCENISLNILRKRIHLLCLSL